MNSKLRIPLCWKEGGPDLVVTNANDADDGVCGLVDCTLREAVSAANALAGADTITFKNGVTGTISLALGTLNVTDAVTISGPGARALAVSGFGVNTNQRIFNVSSASGGSVVISGLTIKNGAVTGASGASAAGGGLFNQATLTLISCTFSGNSARGGTNTVPRHSGGNGNGGAIANIGRLTLNRCLFLGNNASGGNGGDDLARDGKFGGNGGAAQGGAVFNATGAALFAINCTFTSNSASGGEGGDAIASTTIVDNFGGAGGAACGALFNQGTMTVTSCTLANNTGNGGAGGISDVRGRPGEGVGGLMNSGGSATVRNCLSAGNTGKNGGGADVDGAFTSEGFNLIGKNNGSTGFTAAGDQTGTNAAPLDAKLGPLQNNGGPNDSRAPQNGSPALDKGNSFGVTTDQRGQPRPFDDAALPNASGGDGSDIGAYEAQALPTVDIDDVTVTEGDSGTLNADFTVSLSAPSGPPVKVQFETVSSGANAATPGVDFVGMPLTTLSFASGEISKKISVPIIGDTLDEANEKFQVSLSNPSGAILGKKDGICTIADNDPPPSLSISDASVLEGNSGTVNATFTVSLSVPSGQTVSVQLATSSTGTNPATANVDYVAVSPITLSFAPGTTSQMVSVQVIGDTASEPSETFAVDLSNAVNATIADGQGVGTILDDDGPPTIESFTPTSGLPSPPLNVVITGTRFLNVQMVEFNGVGATFTVDSPVQITAVLPTNASTGPIKVTTAQGSATSATNFTVNPGIKLFTPTEGYVGTTVVIQGWGLLGATSVKFNGVRAAFTVNSVQQITATVPPGATTGKISVTTAAGTAMSATDFVVLACADDVSSQVEVTRGQLQFSGGDIVECFAGRCRFTQQITLRNKSARTLRGPLSLALDNLNARATLLNADGETSCAAPSGSPFVQVSAQNLAAGATATVTLEFQAEGYLNVTYDTRVLAGSSER